MTKAVERTPSASFMEALESFVAWMVNAEHLLASEVFEINELEVMEHQLSQYLVRFVPSYLFNGSTGILHLCPLLHVHENEQIHVFSTADRYCLVSVHHTFNFPPSPLIDNI